MTIKNNDLKNCVYPEISVDEYESKAGRNDEVIVVAFYVIEEDAAEDLDEYLEKSWVDVLDVDVSPSPTVDGKYMVFIELPRNDEFFDKFYSIIDEVENLSGKLEWTVTTRGIDYHIPYDSKELLSMVDTSGYSIDNSFMEESFGIDNACDYLSESNFDVDEKDGKVRLKAGINEMYLDVIALDDIDKLTEHCKGMSMAMGNGSYETIFLRRYLGADWEVTELSEAILLRFQGSDKTLMVRV